jgi:hypothetical protein
VVDVLLRIGSSARCRMITTCSGVMGVEEGHAARGDSIFLTGSIGCRGEEHG